MIYIAVKCEHIWGLGGITIHWTMYCCWHVRHQCYCNKESPRRLSVQLSTGHNRKWFKLHNNPSPPRVLCWLTQAGESNDMLLRIFSPFCNFFKKSISVYAVWQMLLSKANSWVRDQSKQIKHDLQSANKLNNHTSRAQRERCNASKKLQ